MGHGARSLTRGTLVPSAATQSPVQITNSDRVALSPKPGQLNGSLLVSGARHPTMTKGRWVAHRDIASLRRSRRDLIATSG
jgi:hypothetical protein